MPSYLDLQENARRNTRNLVLLLTAAVGAVVVELFLFVRAVASKGAQGPPDDLQTLLIRSSSARPGARPERQCLEDESSRFARPCAAL